MSSAGEPASLLGQAKTKMFQYWDTRTPPVEIAGWVEGFKSDNPDFDHILWNEETGAEFISAHYGEAHFLAFKACAVPAMQADYLRLCLMDAVGGVYIDADHQSRQPLASMIAAAPEALIPKWRCIVANGELYFRRPRHPFIAACLTLATDNIRNRRFESILMSAGPGVFCAIRSLVDEEAGMALEAMIPHSSWKAEGWSNLREHAARIIEPTPELVSAYQAMTLMDVAQIDQWIGSLPAQYKATDAYWPNWKGSIYR